jgi:hypothetical protein
MITVFLPQVPPNVDGLPNWAKSLMTTLTAYIQQQNAVIATLEERIEALENAP